MRSLYTRLFISLLLVAVLSIVLVALIAGWGTLDQFWRYVSAQTLREQQAIAAVIDNQVRRDGLESIDSLAQGIREAFGQDITLTGPQGDVLFSSQGEFEVIEERLVVEDGQVNEALVLTYRSDGQVERVSLEERDPVSGRIINDSQDAQDFFASVNQIFLWTGVVAVVLAGAASLILARRIIRPIRALTKAAGELEGGDLGRRVAVQGSDELAQLAGAFNSMAESLQKQESLRRHMVSDIAHELRTPLTNVYGYLEAIQEGLIQPDQPSIQSIMEETQLLNALVAELQDLTLAEAGELRLNLQALDLRVLIQRVVEAQRPQAQRKEIDLQVNLQESLPLVNADSIRTAQIINNLIANSMRYTPKNGRIEVIVETAEGPFIPEHEQAIYQIAQQNSSFLRVTVRDNGPGIPPEHQAHVFERFYRADSARSRTTGGTGLGLAICKMLVEMQGGQIWLESGQGQGTAVMFTLVAQTD